MQRFRPMLPFILLIAVTVVGVLGLVAMVMVARQHWAAWRRERALAMLRSERLAEGLRLAAEHATILATPRPVQQPQPQMQPQPVPVPQPQMRPQPVPVPRAANAVSLTQLFTTLEESAAFVRPPAAEAPVPRTRLAKGSVPIPMTTSQLAGSVRINPVPPPLPPRGPARAMPPPIPGVRRVRST